MNDIYNEKYFSWQRTIGEFGGKANIFKFEQHIRPTDVVLDFGCGGGWLLKNLECARRMGVEVNPVAAKVAAENGIECYASLDVAPDESVNVVISNHALEHVHSPYKTLKQLRRKLVSDGLLVVVAPCEGSTLFYDRNDVNQHLYTWNPQLLGNLATHAGYDVIDVFPLYHKWPRNFLGIQRRFGWRVFHFLARLNGKLKWRDFQVKIVAVNRSRKSVR